MTTKIGNLTLTTDHAASSYGQPVLLVDGVAYGPCDEVPSPRGYGVRAVYIVATDAPDYGPYTEADIDLICKFIAGDPGGAHRHCVDEFPDLLSRSAQDEETN